MGDVIVQPFPHIQQTPARRRWFQGTHNTPQQRAKDLAETSKPVVPPHTWPAAHKEYTLPTVTKPVHQPSTPVGVQSTLQRQTPVTDAPRKSPPSPCKPSIRTSSNLTVSECIKTHQDDSKNPNKPDETPSSQRMDVDTPSPPDVSMRTDVSGDSADKFWMGTTGRASKFIEPTTPTPLPRQPAATAYRFDIGKYSMETKVASPVVHPITADDTDVDSASTCSYSVLSNDTVESPPQPRLTRFTSDEEFAFFNHIYRILDASLAEWEERVNYQSGVPLSLEKFEDAILSLPEICESPVIFGCRPDHNGFWEGRLRLTGKYTEIKKLRAPSFENKIGFGVEIGSIKDFESMGGAILFMGIDRQMYYTDQFGWFDQDEFGRYCYDVIGPYDFRSLSKDKVLDPLPPGHAVVWGNDMRRKEENT
jgi:hypothetical protein